MPLKSELPVRWLARALTLLTVAGLAGMSWWAWLDQTDARHGPVLRVPIKIEQAVELHLYYDVGRGFGARDVLVQHLQGEPVWQVLTLPLPRESIQGLRLDPMMAPGRFEMGLPWLETVTGRLIRRFPRSAVTPRWQITRWADTAEGFAAETEPAATDAQVSIELTEPLSGGRPRPWLGWLLAAFLLAGGRAALARHPALSSAPRWRDRVENGLRAWSEVGGGGRILLGALVVVVAQAWLLRGIGDGMDWPLWDEANYAGRGADWAAGRAGALGELHTGPGFVLNYGVLAWFGDAGRTVVWQHYVVKLGAALMLYCALVRLWRSPLAALGATVAWSATWFQLMYPTLVYQAAWLWFLAAVAVIDRWPVVGVLTLAWAVTYRQDYQFALPVAVGWLGWVWWRSGRRLPSLWMRGDAARPVARGGAVVAGLALVVALGVVARGSAWGGVGQRGWFAFQQHYAVRAVQAGEVTGLNPYAEYPRVIAADFPGATSLGEAWATNPGAIGRHVAWNVRHAFGKVVDYWQPAPGLAPLVVLAGALALAALLARRRGGAEGVSRSGALAVLLGGLLVIAPGLVVLARETYLLPALALLLGVTGLGVAALGRWLGDGGRLWLRRVAFVLGLGVTGLLVAAPRVFDAGIPHRAVAMTADALAEIWPEEGRHVLIGYAASSYEVYLGRDRCRGVEPVNAVTGDPAPNRTVSELLAQEQPFAVLVSTPWVEAAEVDETPLRERVAAGTWAVRGVPGGQLYWRLPQP